MQPKKNDPLSPMAALQESLAPRPAASPPKRPNWRPTAAVNRAVPPWELAQAEADQRNFAKVLAGDEPALGPISDTVLASLTLLKWVDRWRQKDVEAAGLVSLDDPELAPDERRAMGVDGPLLALDRTVTEEAFIPERSFAEVVPEGADLSWEEVYYHIEDHCPPAQGHATEEPSAASPASPEGWRQACSKALAARFETPQAARAWVRSQMAVTGLADREAQAKALALQRCLDRAAESSRAESVLVANLDAKVKILERLGRIIEKRRGL